GAHGRDANLAQPDAPGLAGSVCGPPTHRRSGGVAAEVRFDGGLVGRGASGVGGCLGSNFGGPGRWEPPVREQVWLYFPCLRDRQERQRDAGSAPAAAEPHAGRRTPDRGGRAGKDYPLTAAKTWPMSPITTHVLDTARGRPAEG